MYYSNKDGFKITSCNGVFNAITTNRNIGKTWLFKKRAIQRALKHNKKTIWLRLFDDEAKQCKASFFRSADLQKYCKVSFYNKDTNPNGNIVQIGDTIYTRRLMKNGKAKLEWAIQIVCLSQVGSMRSVDDVKCDTIIFDEFTKPIEKYNLYRGNIANDLNDLFISIKRKHKVRVFMLGNKESVSNPIYDYFKITPPLANQNGVFRYRNGSFIIQNLFLPQDDNSNYEKQLKDLFNNTTYGEFLYDDKTRSMNNKFKTYDTLPSKAKNIFNFDIQGTTLSVYTLNNIYYINDKVLYYNIVYSNNDKSMYPKTIRLINRLRNMFVGLTNAFILNNVIYKNQLVYEKAQALRDYLQIK